ncbi:MAG: hypothetical protein ACXIT9_00860 [Nitritalea sp.]
MKNPLFFLVLCLFLVSCKVESQKEVLTFELEPDRVVSELDSLFFVKVSFNKFNSDNFILSQNPAFLSKTSSDFEPIWTYNKEGVGPGELRYPEQSVIRDGILYVLDHGNQSLKSFDIKGGSFLSSFRIPKPVMRQRFAISNNGNFYFSVLEIGENNSVVEVDSSGELIRYIGVNFPETGVGSNRQMKLFQLDENDNIILIGASLPYIEILDNSGKSLNSFSLTGFEPIRRALDSLENDIITKKRGHEPSSIPIYIEDAQYVNGRLYVSFTDRIGLDRTKARNLLEFKLDENSCDLERIFKFKTGTDDDRFHPLNFYVDDNNKKLMVQGLVTKNIYEFKLPD